MATREKLSNYDMVILHSILTREIETYRVKVCRLGSPTLGSDTEALKHLERLLAKCKGIHEEDTGPTYPEEHD